ncbi:DoxX family protein, partial [Streptomyces mirabilis]|uniref:DoxX family protein n=1 Tax=Streptomyces mirabilis TaxID=68239 RepID=UPI003448D2DA
HAGGDSRGHRELLSSSEARKTLRGSKVFETSAGLFTPLAAAALIGVMINAMATVSGAHGLWDTQGGVEYSVCITVTALAVAAIGPGKLAVDRLFPWGKGGWAEAAVALFLGGIGAAIVLLIL